MHGDLGSGKTTFVKGVVSAFADCDEHCINSPTFTYLNIYESHVPIFHFDLYRLSGEKDFLDKGFLDFLTSNEGICFIEWPEKIPSVLPSHTKHIYFQHERSGGRTIEIS